VGSIIFFGSSLLFLLSTTGIFSFESPTKNIYEDSITLNPTQPFHINQNLPKNSNISIVMSAKPPDIPISVSIVSNEEISSWNTIFKERLSVSFSSRNGGNFEITISNLSNESANIEIVIDDVSQRRILGFDFNAQLKATFLLIISGVVVMLIGLGIHFINKNKELKKFQKLEGILLNFFGVSIILSLIFFSPAFADQQEIWESLAPMPTPRSEVGIVAIDDHIYVIGGHDTRYRALDILEVYDTKNDKWEKLSPLPAKLHHSTATAHDGKIYYVGGFETGWRKATNNLFIYDPSTDTWSRGTDMPTARGALTAEFIGHKLYVIGGKHHESMAINEVYDHHTDSWETKAPMPTARDHFSSTVIDEKIYVIGGRLNANNARNLDANEAYDPNNDSWEILEPLKVPRSGLAATSLNGTMFVIGGESNLQNFGDNAQYIPQEGWVDYLEMLTPRHGAEAVTVDDKIYVIGGGVTPGLSVSGINEVYYNPNVIPEFGIFSLMILAISLAIITAYLKFGNKIILKFD